MPRKIELLDGSTYIRLLQFGQFHLYTWLALQTYETLHHEIKKLRYINIVLVMNRSILDTKLSHLIKF